MSNPPNANRIRPRNIGRFYLVAYLQHYPFLIRIEDSTTSNWITGGSNDSISHLGKGKHSQKCDRDLNLKSTALNLDLYANGFSRIIMDFMIMVSRE